MIADSGSSLSCGVCLYVITMEKGFGIIHCFVIQPFFSLALKRRGLEIALPG